MKRFHVAAEAQWVEKEFSTVDFGDERLTNRFFEVARALASAPEKPIGQVCETKAAVKGAYRLFGNEDFDTTEILTSHFCETAKRMKDEKTVLVIHDTSQIKFNGHLKTVGLGSLNRKHSDTDRSVFLHPALAVTTQGLPLGLVSYQCLTRTRKDNEGYSEQQAKRRRKPSSQKESIRWIDGLEETRANIDINKHQVVNVADRESDFYEFILAAIERESSFVVRSKGDRNVQLSDGRSENIRQAFEYVKSAKILELKVPKNNDQQERRFKASVKFLEATIPLPLRAYKRDTISEAVPISVFAIQVKEINPKTRHSVEWILITNVAVKNVKDALKIVDWYKARWSIEIFFKILKSGCRVEECRLQSFEKLDRYIALMSVIAFRIFYLSRIGKAAPDEKCTTVLPISNGKHFLSELRELIGFRKKLLLQKKQ
jgi:hypothetical protein